MRFVRHLLRRREREREPSLKFSCVGVLHIYLSVLIGDWLPFGLVYNGILVGLYSLDPLVDCVPNDETGGKNVGSIIVIWFGCCRRDAGLSAAGLYLSAKS